MVAEAVKERLRAQYRTLDPVRDPLSAGGTRQSHRPSCRRRAPRGCRCKKRGRAQHDLGAYCIARRFGNDLAGGEPRATHRRPKRRYKKRIRIPSKLDPHAAPIESWLASKPQLTAIAIRSPRQAPSRPVRQEAAFDRAASAASPCAGAPRRD